MLAALLGETVESWHEHGQQHANTSAQGRQSRGCLPCARLAGSPSQPPYHSQSRFALQLEAGHSTHGLRGRRLHRNLRLQNGPMRRLRATSPRDGIEDLYGQSGGQPSIRHVPSDDGCKPTATDGPATHRWRGQE